MSRLKRALSPEVAKLILESYSIARKRSAFRFFKEDLKESLKSSRKEEAFVDQASANEKSAPIKKNLRSTKLWHDMEPEAKRKYFNRAKFDEVRHKEQKALWVAEIGTFIAKHGNQVDKLAEAVSIAKNKQEKVLESLEKYRNNFEHLIQTQSTRNLYKDVIAKVDKINLDSEDMISSVPEDLKPVLERPRRPPAAFILYTMDNREQLHELQQTEFKHLGYLQVAAHLWNKLNREERQKYEDQYAQLLEEYNKAKEKFRREVLEKKGVYLDQASKEKRAIAVSLRRKLKTFAVVPLNVRNAFNFFVIDHKDVPLSKLTDLWRNLPESEKLKYRKMHAEDTVRYYSEKKYYNEIIDTISDLIKKSKK